MSEKYIKRTKKGKGHKKKETIKDFYLGEKGFVEIKPVIHIAMSLMIMEDLKNKEKDLRRSNRE